jgi:hypothetical protein
VIGVLNRGGWVRTKVIPDTPKKTVQDEVRAPVEPGSLVCTDSLSSYGGLVPDFVHEAVDHATESVRGNTHTNRLENYWSLLKRCLRGTYVSVESFHLFRHPDEQAFRYNERKRTDARVKTDGERFIDVTGAIIGKRLAYEKPTGKSPESPPQP